MKIHLYQLTNEEAFLLSKEALTRLEFTIHLADEKKGLITASKPVHGESDILFFNILFTDNMPFATLRLISNIFCGANGTFIAKRGSEEPFLKCLDELIKTTFKEFVKMTLTDNSPKQSEEDRALVAELV